MIQAATRGGWKLAGVGLVAGALLISGPISPVASAGVRTPSHVTGNTYGGLTAQGNPVIVDMNSTRRQVVRVVTNLELTCTSGDSFISRDGYVDLRVGSLGKFRTSFGPDTQRNDDGTTTDWQGKITGSFNDAKTRISGLWRLVAIEHDATGAVTDTCTSNLVGWRAKA